MSKIRVLSVDDSALMRQIMTEIINSHSDMEMVATAPDPLVARDLITSQRRGNRERGARAVCSAGTDFVFTGTDAEYDDHSVVDCRSGVGVGVPVYEAVYPSPASGAGRGVWLVDSNGFCRCE